MVERLCTTSMSGQSGLSPSGDLHGNTDMKTSISANADGQHNVASHKIDHIALPTKYN